MRTTRTAFVVIVAALAVAACAQAAPGWTYAPPPPSPSAGPSAATSVSPAASAAAPSAAASAAPASATPSGATASAGVSAAPPSAAAPSAAPSSGGGTSTTIKLLASGVQFDQSALTAPANAPFQIAFTNNDAGIQHNVALTSSSGQQVFAGDLFAGVGTTTYNVPALPAGTYTFMCQVHPNMTGTLTVQ